MENKNFTHKSKSEAKFGSRYKDKSQNSKGKSAEKAHR
jgi:hypothetical protein